MEKISKAEFAVYAIRHIASGKAYFGCTADAKKREDQHRKALRRGKHYNKSLQEMWSAEGEASFTFEIIETLKTREEGMEREEFWIKEPGPAFNVAHRGIKHRLTKIERIIPRQASIEQQAIRVLLSHADAWCAAKGGASWATVGRYAQNDPHFFFALQKRLDSLISGDSREDKKGSCTFRIYDKVIAWFYDEDNWPADAEFPPLPDLTHEPKDGSYGETGQERRRGTQKARAPARDKKQGKGSGSQTGSLLKKLRSRAEGG